MKISKKVISLVLCMVLLTSCIMTGCSQSNTKNYPVTTCATASNPLPSWSDDSPAKAQIINFVSTVTNENSSDFVPVEDRIATFDFDGTLILEKDLGLEQESAKYRIENYLSDDTELVNELNDLVYILLNVPEHTTETHNKIVDVVTKAFAGMTSEESADFVNSFMDQPKFGFDNLTCKQSFYLPMVELVQYLENNDFTVYIVSGSEINVCRGAQKDVLGLPNNQILGGITNMQATGNTDNDSSYVYSDNDEYVRSLGFSSTCDGFDKVGKIDSSIGIQPIFAFGNSSGDFSMLNYAMSNPNYIHCAFLLQHDDSDREVLYNDDQQAKWNETANLNGWTVVSMKNEFNQVFMVPDATKTVDSSNSAAA